MMPRNTQHRRPVPQRKARSTNEFTQQKLGRIERVGPAYEMSVEDWLLSNGPLKRSRLEISKMRIALLDEMDGDK